MPEEKKEIIEEKEKEKNKKTLELIQKLATYFEKLNAGDYLFLAQKPRRMLILSFCSGLLRGLGMALGMTVLFGLIIFLLKEMIDAPLIGKYLAHILNEINKYKAIR